MNRAVVGRLWRVALVLLLVSLPSPAWSAGQDAGPGESQQDSLRLVCTGMGFQNGYLDGWEMGVSDAKYNRGRPSSDFRTTALYEAADRGYAEKWRYLDKYQDSYRAGMEKGYADGFQKRGNLVLARFRLIEDDLRDQEKPIPQRGDDRRRPAATVPAGTRILLVLNDYLTTKMNAPGDRFTATVARTVFVGNVPAVAEGALVEGAVGQVVRPGRVKGRAEMNLRFETLKTRQGDVALSATLTGLSETEGEIRGNEGTVQGQTSHGRDAGVVAAGTGAGTVVGVIAGGGKGAGIGALVGALVGLTGVLATRGEDIEIPKGATVEITLDKDLRLSSKEE